MLIPPVNWGLVERGLSRSGLPSLINFPFLDKQKIRTILYLAEEDGEEDDEGGGGEGSMKGALDQAVLSFIADNSITLHQLGGNPSLNLANAAALREANDASSFSSSSHASLASSSAVAVISAQQQTPMSGVGKIASGGKEARGDAKAQSNWKPTSEDLVIAALNLILDPRHYPLHIMCSTSGRHRTGVVIGCFRKLQRWTLSSIFAEYRRYAGGSRGAQDVRNEVMQNEQFIELFDIDLVTNTMQQRQLQKHLRSINVVSAHHSTSKESSSSSSSSVNLNALPSGSIQLSKKVSITAASSSTSTVKTPAQSPSAASPANKLQAQQLPSSQSHAQPQSAPSPSSHQQQQQQQQQLTSTTNPSTATLPSSSTSAAPSAAALDSASTPVTVASVPSTQVK